MPTTTVAARALSQPNRAFCEAFIVQYDIDVPTISAYADTLANDHWAADRPTRHLLCVAMTALIDGWLAGYEAGYHARCDEGERCAHRGPRDTQEVQP